MKIQAGYTLLEEMTRGAGGRVFRVRRDRDGLVVVHKVVNNDPLGRHEQSMHEAIQAANPGGPSGVVRLLRAAEEGRDLVLELENFDESLDAVRPADVAPIVILNAALDAVQGLLEMHRAGVIDDDVKLSNLVFKADRQNRIAHCDLGGARTSRDARSYGCTPPFAAPEIMQGRLSDTSPVYGWAISMEMLCLGAIGALNEGYNLGEVLPWVGTDFGTILLDCTQVDPSRRPPVPALHTRIRDWVHRRRRCACGPHVLPGGRCKRCNRAYA